MGENIKLFLSDNIAKVSLIMSLLLILINVGLVIYFQNRLPPYIPLFNSLPWGTDRLSPSIAALLFPLSFIVVFCGNSLVGALMYKRYALVSRLLALNVLLFVLIGFISYVQILLLVF